MRTLFFKMFLLVVASGVVAGCRGPTPLEAQLYTSELQEADVSNPLFRPAISTGNVIVDVVLSIIMDSYRRAVATNPSLAGVYFAFFLVIILLAFLVLIFIVLRESRLLVKWAKETFGKDKSMENRMMDLLEQLIFERKLDPAFRDKMKREMIKSIIESDTKQKAA